MSPSPLVLVVDDEATIREVVRRYLEADGLQVVEAGDGETALAMVADHRPDVVILDVMMPGTDGIEVLRRIRADGDAYVIMLTARAEEVDRVIGLSVGADDYVTKPFSARELALRVKAMLRRPRTGVGLGDEPVAGGLVVDTDRREVSVDGAATDVRGLEFDLLAALASAPGRVFSRRQLLERVWGYDYYGDERVVDVHIRSLRKALGDDADAPRFVATVRGVGYKLLDGAS
ncbi:MAG: response regulator transcription factor [Acidimicrobiaceae bacterium]|nr:response regulator transcription factor [Ilumatobacter sp.]MCB9381049.1 response regulator transcription factor [Acidimicrobiaceae bacterium]MCO5330749.1 response regulator transcription factor [Ilumatobacteraceae bacterium]